MGNNSILKCFVRLLTPRVNSAKRGTNLEPNLRKIYRIEKMKKQYPSNSDFCNRYLSILLAMSLAIPFPLIPNAHAEKRSLSGDKIDVRVVDWDVSNSISVNVDEVGGWYVSNGVLRVVED